MPKPNIKKAIHTGEFDRLAAPSIRLAITNIRMELDDVERHLHDARVRAHWLSSEEKEGLDPSQVAERQQVAMQTVQRLARRWNRLTARFCEAWQVWQLKLQAETDANHQPATSN
jgi:uncharacterized damage-inducible protein DinB